jgi:hypothetical protein
LKIANCVKIYYTYICLCIGMKATAATAAAGQQIQRIDDRLHVSQAVTDTKAKVAAKASGVDEKYEITAKATVFTTAVGDKVNFV